MVQAHNPRAINQSYILLQITIAMGQSTRVRASSALLVQEDITITS